MYVDVDLSRNPAALELREPGDFTAFKLVTHGEGELAPAIADIGRVDGQAHVYLRPDAIRVLAGEAGNDPAWRKGFDAMLAFAREHGWIGADGAVRAHVEAGPGFPN